MKRRRLILIPLLLCFMLLLTGCNKNNRLTGRIAHIYGATLLIAGDDGELYSASAGDADTGGEKLTTGQSVEIVYEEGLMETFPAQLGSVKEIHPTGEHSNIIDVFTALIGELMAQDLLQPTAMLAYDFGELELLTKGEQQAVGYICWTKLDLEPTFGTKEELTEQGIIFENDKGAYLPDGWLLTFAMDEEQTDLLHISLWRNDDAASEYTCRIFNEDGEWHYEFTE